MNDQYKSFVEAYKRSDEYSPIWGMLFIYSVILLIVGGVRALLGLVPITHLTAIWTWIGMDALYHADLLRKKFNEEDRRK